MHIQMKNKILPLFIILVFLSCCADTPGKRSNNDPSPSRIRTPAASARYSGKILQPSDGDTFTAGEEIEFEIRLDEDAGEVVSVKMTVDGKETEFPVFFQFCHIMVLQVKITSSFIIYAQRPSQFWRRP